ncbi:unnamed protein product [Rotaria socialis]|uniref:Oxidation resistance protein 1 n=1 Tax=Rotaria socialis TaxID=392032 RepID=A0A817T5T4_9BILA|nr:unnamed protein product [Rotaria socialis]CAF3312628.1 unnamed protein product [Rotaria socialis]CAF3321200.1 unnamed protein product [Rotaria socialis]CAF3433067.1 unnamed protein product [Rotaria socialis]CAF3711423.1 unnamed protein product [Rotaria socialis]
MIRTLSKTLSDTSYPSTESLPTRSRRPTLDLLVSRLSDSKKHFLDQIPHHQQKLTKLRKRAKSLLSSSFTDQCSFDRKNFDEIISVDEIYRRINATQTNNANSSNFGIPPPKLLQPSTLIDEEKSKSILLELPPRVHGLNWQILFSTEANGFSLNQLYRRSMQVDVDNPSLLIVKDIEQNIFGAYVSQQLMISEGFYGTGETFLFTFHPQFRVFHWTGNNQFFIKGDVKALGLGSGEGTYGLWLDADLYHGRTCPSKTFNNTRLSSKEDFIIASIELWTFID